MTTYEKYKIGLLGVFVIGFLLCFYEYSENGRYVFSNETGTSHPIIIDSKTGELYNIHGWEKVNINEFKDLKSKKINK
ncbi:hypothetical protein [Flavobacterium luteum]|uniref:Uncharacterized protein n=1 Tax=Flavobacterium luteum TaxID=2026654 RepID=A0A7J5AHK2_9FLAO|nr:hypothetical protein [Flavobacterium luteum]KAB1156878.1 hypothetical protein F6464_05870 [Flavobacterium luteum]